MNNIVLSAFFNSPSFGSAIYFNYLCSIFSIFIYYMDDYHAENSKH